MRRVLIAMEGASCSDDAIQHLTNAFQGEELTVFILAVIPRVCYPLELRSASTLYRWQSEEALVALDRAIAALGQAGFTAFGMIRIGEPDACIVAAAQDIEADLIVLGTHGRKGAKRLIPSSVAESVVRQAPCDVMVNPFDGDPAHGSLDHPAA
jgi:nucleotide-binding universal stress UspA family protein